MPYRQVDTLVFSPQKTWARSLVSIFGRRIHGPIGPPRHLVYETSCARTGELGAILRRIFSSMDGTPNA